VKRNEFAASESAGSVVLMATTALALIAANSPLAPAYATLVRHARFTVDDGLMAVFFLLVGLEIKRELLTGELAGARKAALPVIAALGGMIVPALVYLLITRGTAYQHGWGIPMATDIAFAVGVLSLVGRRAPGSLVVFLTALAIADDLGAVLVIALFYVVALTPWALGAAALVAAAGVALNRAGVRRLWPYLAVGVLLWLALLRSGVHATIAGVLLGFLVPCGGERSPLERLEHALEPWVAFVVLPLFALVNAGLALPWRHLGAAFAHPVTLGVFIGLLAGKTVGVFGATAAAARLGWGERPRGASTRQLFGVASLAGIGFTMSIFIATLAFGEGELLDYAKLGILGASVASAAVGSVVLALTP
jgi:NhaA family Na+:H+ antiporter